MAYKAVCKSHYLTHFNPYHDPKTGRFDFSIYGKTNTPAQYNDKYGEMTIEKKYVDSDFKESVSKEELRELKDMRQKLENEQQKYQDAYIKRLNEIDLDENILYQIPYKIKGDKADIDTYRELFAMMAGDYIDDATFSDKKLLDMREKLDKSASKYYVKMTELVDDFKQKYGDLYISDFLGDNPSASDFIEARVDKYINKMVDSDAYSHPLGSHMAEYYARKDNMSTSKKFYDYWDKASEIANSSYDEWINR